MFYPHTHLKRKWIDIQNRAKKKEKKNNNSRSKRNERKVKPTVRQWVGFHRPAKQRVLFHKPQTISAGKINTFIHCDVNGQNWKTEKIYIDLMNVASKTFSENISQNYVQPTRISIPLRRIISNSMHAKWNFNDIWNITENYFYEKLYFHSPLFPMKSNTTAEQ